MGEYQKARNKHEYNVEWLYGNPNKYVTKKYKKDISKTRRTNTKRDMVKQYKEYQKEEYYWVRN